MIHVQVTRKTKAYIRGVDGIGNVDWEVRLECGHIITRPTEAIVDQGFRDELECIECIEKFTKEIEMYSQPQARSERSR